MAQAPRKVQEIREGEDAGTASGAETDPLREALSRNYDDVLAEALPERLLALLDELRRKEDE